ncbi:hypothetical protein [Infirmifilum sp. NZ]|uniref:hypothetical protein n=1 Tax=Infirmifilum sp. NZ TaxID=2926850 RepID=UPI002798FE6B|nr:hypothetical protein [Infirmifilum sp. NZ]UNQ72823.1 hypothetical protein MOV14_06820 [Infirmifilum sp. NZ]
MEIVLENLTPVVFRASVRVLELISRHSLSLDSAFQEALGEFSLKPGERKAVYLLSKGTLESIGPAIYTLRKHGKESLPLRRRMAFLVAFYLVRENWETRLKLKAVRGGLLSDSLMPLLSERAIEKAMLEIKELPAAQRLAYEESIPPLVAETALAMFGEKASRDVLRSLKRRHVWVRVTEPGLIDCVKEYLSRRSFSVKIDEDTPSLLSVELNTDDPLPQLPKGAVYQDKASVIAVEAFLSLNPRGLIADLAAAPCLKSSIVCNKATEAEIIAVDVSQKRLPLCRSFMDSSRCVYDLVCSDGRFFQSMKRFDGVVVDAPCTNSGAIPRDPGLRLALWDLSRSDLEKMSQTQVLLLRNALRLSKPHAPILFSTCSIFPEEGERVLAKLEKAFKPLKPMLPPSLESRLIKPCEGCYRLYPHLHRTDGFFFSTITRTV